MFASRRRDPTPHLAWRVRLFIGAAILALVGMFTDQQLPIWGAIGLLAVAFVLRFVGDEAVDDEEDEDHDGNDDEDTLVDQEYLDDEELHHGREGSADDLSPRPSGDQHA